MDEPNRLHFYVLDLQRESNGILSYTLAVRSLDRPSAQTRGVSAAAAAALDVAETGSRLDVRVTNTGTGGTAEPAHSNAPAAAFTSDVYRVSTSVEGAGWTAELQNALVAIPSAAAATVPVFIGRASSAKAPARVTVTIVSESDPSKRATVTTTLTRGPGL